MARVRDVLARWSEYWGIFIRNWLCFSLAQEKVTEYWGARHGEVVNRSGFHSQYQNAYNFRSRKGYLFYHRKVSSLIYRNAWTILEIVDQFPNGLLVSFQNDWRFAHISTQYLPLVILLVLVIYTHDNVFIMSGESRIIVIITKQHRKKIYSTLRRLLGCDR